MISGQRTFTTDYRPAGARRQGYATYRFRKLIAKNCPAFANRWYAWKEKRLLSIRDKLITDIGLSVQAGPFCGMKYISTAHGSALLPKILGTYEEALHPFIYRVLKRNYQLIADIGCAEGYYAVGFARAFRKIPVQAFDIDPQARTLCRKLAEVNGLADLVSITDNCTIDVLNKILVDSTLIISDCEGYEFDLLRPELIPKLSSSDLIVELHDLTHPTICEVITNRFEETHQVSLITNAAVDQSRSIALESLSWLDRRLARSEWRGPGNWAYLESKAVSSGFGSTRR